MITSISFPSYFDSSISIDRQHASVTMICDANRAKNHALLVVEKINDSDRLTQHFVHLIGVASYDPPNKVAFNGCCSAPTGHRKIGKVIIQNMTGKKIDYTHKSNTWLCSAEKVQDLMLQAELEKNKPSEFPRPFSIFGNRSIFTTDLDTFKITDPFIAAIAHCDTPFFLKIYDRVKKCRDGCDPGIERLKKPYFNPLVDIYDGDGGYNIAWNSIVDTWHKDSVWDQRGNWGFLGPDDTLFSWSYHISRDRLHEILQLFCATRTSEDRARLVEEAPRKEKKFFREANEELERRLRINSDKLTTTTFWFGYHGYGDRVRSLSQKIITTHPELKERTDEFMNEFHKDPLPTCCDLMMTIFHSTDLYRLTPDSCFTWAREKLTLIDVQIPDIGIESCISPTKCYLTPVKKILC